MTFITRYLSLKCSTNATNMVVGHGSDLACASCTMMVREFARTWTWIRVIVVHVPTTSVVIVGLLMNNIWHKFSLVVRSSTLHNV
jgi:hypothetical protein